MKAFGKIIFLLIMAKGQLLGKSWIIFYADKPSVSNASFTGHVFVSFIKEDSYLQQTTVIGCWGFYPKSGIGAFGEVEGEIRNDISRQKSIGFMVEICEVEFNKCLSKKNEWDTKKYSLAYNNCIDFVDDIARQVPKLMRPSTASSNGVHPIFPTDYIKNLKSLNPNYKVDCPVTSSTLFLIDVSGSMLENNKIDQARLSAASTISITKQEAQQSGKSPEIGILVFSGDCVADPTTVIQPFSTDLDEVQASINNIPFPNGNTPSPQAVVSAQKALERQLAQNGQTCGTLIVMSDGQSSCGTVIPPNAFYGKKEYRICGQGGSTSVFNITTYAVGFDVPPGSVAERELQYLANTSGGKYFNAQDQYQLTRSFQKINRIYTPIANPQTKTVDASLNGMFNSGYIYVTSTQQYDTALVLYKKFTTAYPADSSGQYNYALMCEANERYKTAVKYYEIYLQHALNDPNRQVLLERIATLRKDYDIQLAYNKQVIQSDLAYLKQHFEQLRTTPNAVPLAGEFAGFIQEKQTFYKALPDILEMEDNWLKQYAKEITQALKEASYFLSKNPGQWDLNGVSIIGNVYEPLDRLAKKLGK